MLNRDKAIEADFKVAERAGLDLVRASQETGKPGMQALPEQLAALVAEEVAKVKK